jgi:AraC-like DNA-binding protein
VHADRYAVDPGLKVFVTDLRLSWTRVLRRAGLPADLLVRGSAQLRPPDYFGLWAALDAEAGDRNLALEVGQAISVEAFNPPILAALCSPTLAIAADRIAAYKPLIGPLRINASTTDAGLRITYQWPGDRTPPELLMTSEIVFWVALARIATRHHIRPTAVTLPVPARDPEAIEAYFGAPIHRGPAHSVSFTAGDASRPFLTENEPLWRFFGPELRRRLAEVDARASVADRVRAALHETLPVGDPAITAVTAKLAVSPRTLQRQLHSEGTTYQAVLTDTRHQLARHYLQRSDLRTPEIAYLLGYDDTNSFYRAFKTWTGTTPDTHRAATTTSTR